MHSQIFTLRTSCLCPFSSVILHKNLACYVLKWSTSLNTQFTHCTYGNMKSALLLIRNMYLRKDHAKIGKTSPKENVEKWEVQLIMYSFLPCLACIN